MKFQSILLHLFLLSLIDFRVLGVKITILHVKEGSSHLLMKVVGEELARRGHEVTICKPSSLHDNKTVTTIAGKSLKILSFDQGFQQKEWENIFRDFPLSKSIISQVMLLNKMLWFFDLQCAQILSNPQVIKSIQEADLLLLQVNLPCSGPVAKIFKKKWIAMATGMAIELISLSQQVYINPSILPSYHFSLTDQMSFSERVENYLVQRIIAPLFLSWSRSYLVNTMSKVGPSSSDQILEANKAEMIIGNCDFAVVHAHPRMPNSICAGSLTAKAGRKLPSELEEFMNSSQHGVVMSTFGTLFGFLHEWQVKSIAGAFRRLRQKVLWQLTESYDVVLPPNVKVLKWLPQNDVLAHPKTKLFISHGGLNSVLEASYHGVPVLAIPRGIDHHQNSMIISKKLKIGERLDVDHATEDDWFNTIEKILSNESYAVNAHKVSHRMRSRKQTSLELTGDLIQYVIDNDFDMSHLKSRGQDLPWHVVNLYDVYAFLISVCIVLILFVNFIIKKCLLIVFGRKEKKNKY